MASAGRSERRRGRGAGLSVTGFPRTRRLDQPERLDGDHIGALPAPIPEPALFPPVADKLAKDGYTSWRDVSFLGSWIDLYARAETGHTIAVELKVADWRRALAQAQLLRNSANAVYIALWAPYVHRAMTDQGLALLADAGVGLLSVNGNCTVKLASVTNEPRYLEHVHLPRRPSRRAR
jgi:hypothetical protein